jgi:signal transduction histidine kinase
MVALEFGETNDRNPSAPLEVADMSSVSAADGPDPRELGAVIAIGSRAAEQSQRIIARRRSQRAAQKISALGEMTGGIAHDFRNVLCVIASGLSVAETNSGDAQKVESALAAVRDGIDRGMKMTNRLLAFAKQQELVAVPRM